jgi:hypothetical protein
VEHLHAPLGLPATLAEAIDQRLEGVEVVFEDEVVEHGDTPF